MAFKPAARVAGHSTGIFSEMTQLAYKHNAINLSQGYPDFDGPEAVKEAAVAAIRGGQNQYAQGIGQPELRRAIAAHARRFYGQDADPDAEVTVATGASETMFAAILGLIDPGDEVIVFEPTFDIYVPDIEIAGGVVRYVLLRPNLADGVHRWDYDPAELAAAFSERTKAIVVNTPHNPTGKVFNHEELAYIASLCQKWDVIAITDEVYEHIIFRGVRHERLATLPGMAERTVTVSSQGKSFSFTGWKIGWALAPADLTLGIRRAHQTITFASSTPFQAAAAQALALDDEYFSALAAEFQSRRDFLAGVLRQTGMTVTIPDGTYFIMAGIKDLGFPDDLSFCRHLVTELGVAAIPPTAFYCEAHKSMGAQFARFAFCKRAETLERAAERLARLKQA